ncbi:hypothetical protein C0J52_21956 [Blattella germanica]|nr:hypothetical protein C0J52_21956 [Blattella germanica]
MDFDIDLDSGSGVTFDSASIGTIHPAPGPSPVYVSLNSEQQTDLKNFNNEQDCNNSEAELVLQICLSDENYVFQGAENIQAGNNLLRNAHGSNNGQ